jgi:acyl carrier protein
MDNMYEKIAKMIEDIADIPIDEISMSSSFVDDLDLSSLEIMSVVSRAEQEFGINISENDLLSIATVEDFVEIILSKKSRI